MRERYLEDFAVGQIFGSGRLVIDKERIKSFAAEFDPQPFHLDEHAEEGALLQGLAASGWHTAAATMRLLVESGSSPPEASSALASTSSAGRGRSAPETSCAWRAKCSRCGRRSRVRNKD